MTKLQYVLNRVATDDSIGCWRWEGATIKGYSCMYAYGGTKYVHIIAYESRFGPVPDDMELDHKCRNTWCWNPNCQDPVTHIENVQRGLAGITTKVRLAAIKWCPLGHPYDEENTRITKRNTRVCRACARERAILKYYTDNGREKQIIRRAMHRIGLESKVGFSWTKG